MRVDIPGRSLEERVPTTRRVVPLSPRLTCPLVLCLVAPVTLPVPSVRRAVVVLRVPL